MSYGIRLRNAAGSIDVDAGDQGFQAGDASQGNPRLDQPEASTLAQVLARLLVHFDGGHHALDIFADIQRTAMPLYSTSVFFAWMPSLLSKRTWISTPAWS